MAVGLIVTDIVNPYFAELAMAVDLVTHDAGYTTCIGYSLDMSDRQHEIIASMIERQVVGILLLPSHDTDPERLAHQFKGINIPVVLLGRRMAGFDSVGSDDVRGASLVGQHLRSLGCNSVAFLGGVPSAALSEKQKGLHEALARYGCELWSRDAYRTAITPEGGAESLALMLDLGELPDAVVAYNDVVAQGTYEELRRRGLEPGRDIALASFDDTLLAARQVPPLTSVAGFPRTVGTKGADLLMKRLTEPVQDLLPQLNLISPHLRIRSSTASWRPRKRIGQ
jgi:LacI family transcriptional regulator